MSEDAISRKAVISGLASIAKAKARSDTQKSLMGRSIFFVEHMPPVIPIRPRGHWIELDECSNSGYYCSECSKKVVKEGWSNTVKIIKYCPNCGAEMEESEGAE